MTWRILFGLLVCNAIWATNPITGKYLLRIYSPLQVAEFRCGSALLTSSLLLLFFHWRRPQILSPLRVVFSLRNFHWIAAMGLTTFFGSIVLQYLGLSRSTASANSLIVAIEPLFAVFLAWLFLSESISRHQLFAFALAIFGFLLLSNLKPDNLLASFDLFSVGNLFFLAVMPMEALHTIISRKLVGRVEPISIFGWAMLVGFLVLSFYSWAAGAEIPDLRRLDLPAIAALVLLGPVGTAITYIYWSQALKTAPVAMVTLTLFLQPILGALAGIVFLGERMDFWQSLGGSLILIALCWQSMKTNGGDREATGHG